MVPDADDKNPTGGIRGTRHRLRGPSRIDAAAPKKRPAAVPPAQPARSSKSVSSKKRVLFVCIGNSCRSQMAEAFARVYGRDVMDPQSAGLTPAVIIAPLTRQILSEKNVTVGDQFPKGLDMVARLPFDIVVNMSGAK